MYLIGAVVVFEVGVVMFYNFKVDDSSWLTRCFLLLSLVSVGKSCLSSLSSKLITGLGISQKTIGLWFDIFSFNWSTDLMSSIWSDFLDANDLYLLTDDYDLFKISY